jgi:hypothetical protein
MVARLGMGETEVRSKTWGVYAAIVALTAAAALPRVIGLSGMALSDGEAWHALIAGARSGSEICQLVVQHRPHPPGSWLQALLRHDAHPPFYYLVLRSWIGLGLGVSSFALRLPSLAFGLLCIGSFYALGRRVTGGAAGGLTLAILAACSRVMLLQAEQVRHYPLLLLLTTLALACFFSSWRHSSWGYLVCAFAATQTHYVVVVVVAVVGLVRAVLYLRERRVRPLLLWCGAHLLLAALVWAELRNKQPSRVPETYWLQSLGGPNGSIVDSLRRVISAMHFGKAARLDWALVVPFVLGLYWLGARRRWLVLAVSLGPLAIACGLAVAHVYPMVGTAPRWSLWLMPTTVLPIAAAFQELAQRLSRLHLVALSAVIATLFVVSEASTPGGALWHPRAIRVADSRYHWRPISADNQKLAMVQKYVEPDAVVFIPWTEYQQIVLSERLGWQEYRFPHPYVPGDIDGNLTGLQALIKDHPASGRGWAILRAPITPWESFEANLESDSCLVDRQVYRGEAYVLVGFDAEATRRRLLAETCR